MGGFQAIYVTEILFHLVSYKFIANSYRRHKVENKCECISKRISSMETLVFKFYYFLPGDFVLKYTLRERRIYAKRLRYLPGTDL